MPYNQYTGDHCSCNCCFSILYEVSGLAGKNYKVYFNENEIKISDDYYDIVKPSFQVYKGIKINSLNKFGFKEGKWISFFENGKEKVIDQYPDQALFYDLDPIWSKEYYSFGKLSYYTRDDTTESWFEDQELKSQFIKYKIGDTIYEKGFQKFENRAIQEEYFEKFYPTIFKSDFDTNYQNQGSITETIFRKEYFQSGKLKFMFGKDSSFSWFETGQLESKKYKLGTFEYDKIGKLKERTFSWLEKGPEFYRNLNNTLYVYFYPNSNIKEIELVRDEPTSGGIAPSVRYTWKWDKDMNLLEFPEKWDEKFPWIRFAELLPITTKLNKKNR